MEIERLKIGENMACPYGLFNIMGEPYLIDGHHCRQCICYKGCASETEIFCSYNLYNPLLDSTYKEQVDITKLLADKYVLDQNFNDKSSKEDWEEFTARKMRDAFMAGYKEGKESK